MEFQRPLEQAVWQTLKGRCISCGYLCKRVDLLTATVFEASAEDRSYFNFVSHPESPRSTRIWCFVCKEPLYKEFERLTELYGKTRDNAEISWEIITRDINCTKWVPYQAFRSPKEHFEDFKEELNRKERKRTNFIMIGLTIALIVFAVLQLYAVLASINPESWLFEWLR
ncbi:hypothetical protein ACFLTG_03255 [Chloroflexota bacterium]